MTILFANNARATLAAPLTVSGTSLQVAAGLGPLFPSPAGPDYFVVTVTDARTRLLTEIMHCTQRVGDVLTVARAQENTQAQEWAIGDIAAMTWTAGQAAALVQA